jgi:hypothetical protein
MFPLVVSFRLGLAPASKKVEDKSKAKPKITLKLPSKKLPKADEVSLFRVIPRDTAMGAIFSLNRALKAGGGWTAKFFIIVATTVFGLPAFMAALLQATLVEIYKTCTISFLNHYFDNKVVGRSVAAHIFKVSFFCPVSLCIYDKRLGSFFIHASHTYTPPNNTNPKTAHCRGKRSHDHHR